MFAEVDATLASDDTEVLRVKRGADVLPVIVDREPDLVLLDLQIGSMGGIATCIAIRQEEGTIRLAHRPVALLLDREADIFLAQEARAEGWILKPVDSLRLRRMTKRLLAGETSYEGLPEDADSQSGESDPTEAPAVDTDAPEAEEAEPADASA